MKKQFFLFVTFLFAFSCGFNLSAQKPVEVQLRKSDLFGHVSKVVEGRLFAYEEWGEMKYRMDTAKVSWYDASGRKILSMSDRVISSYSYRQDGKIESISYSPRSFREGKYFGELGHIMPSTNSDVYNYTPEGRLISIELRNPVVDGCIKSDLRTALYFDQCIDLPYMCEGSVEDSYDYDHLTKIIFKYDLDGSYQVFMCDETGATRGKINVSTNGRRVANSWGLCEYDASGRLLSWGGQMVANNGVGKWSYLLGYDKKGNLAIETGKEDLVRDVDAVPWLKESANYYGATVFEYMYDDQGNWTRRIEYEIMYEGKKREKQMWGRIIEYDNFLDVNALNQSSKDLIEKNKAAEAQYVRNCFKERFLDDVGLYNTDWENVPLYDIEKIVATYKQYQKAVQEYQKNSDGWSRGEKKTKYKEIQSLGSQLYALMDITPGSSRADSKWYQWLAVIWSEFIKSGDDIPSNYFVAMDAVEKLSEIEGKRSSIAWHAMMYFSFYLPTCEALSQRGLSKGQAYTAVMLSGLEMETKAWTKDMLPSLADDDFMSELELKIQEYQREFKDYNKLRDDYYPR